MSIAASVVGCGRMGKCHVNVLRQSGFRVSAIADPIVGNREEILSTFDVEKELPGSFSSLSELLESSDAELLVIATTADSHASQALNAISAGIKLILLEQLDTFDFFLLSKTSARRCLI
jgi:predicted dehydrogenase